MESRPPPRPKQKTPPKIQSIQVVFGGDPEVALIQFTSNEEACRAMYCAEAVLNNRFINMRWHRKSSMLGSHQLEQGTGSQVGPQVRPCDGIKYRVGSE